jgi:hypothetical protein
MPPQTVATAVQDAYAAVCTVLWSERTLLESLACTAVVTRLIPRRDSRADGTTAVRTASAEERQLVERLQLQEVLRSIVVDALAEATGTSARTLPALVLAAPEPWATMLAEHREALLALADDVAGLDVTAQLSLAEFLG